MTQRVQFLILLIVGVVLVFSSVWASASSTGGQLLSTLPASVSVVAVGLAAVFVAIRMAAASERKPYLKMFRTVAVRLDGWVRENMMGEFQLQVPHPLGGLMVELCSESKRQFSKNPVKHWTRYRFVSKTSQLPSLSLRVDAGVPLSHPRLNPDAARALTLVRDVHLSALRVRVRNQSQVGKPGAIIDVWLQGWPQNADEFTEQIHTVAPQLVATVDALSRT